jgi:hypothetical protein
VAAVYAGIEGCFLVNTWCPCSSIAALYLSYMCANAATRFNAGLVDCILESLNDHPDPSLEHHCMVCISRVCQCCNALQCRPCRLHPREPERSPGPLAQAQHTGERAHLRRRRMHTWPRGARATGRAAAQLHFVTCGSVLNNDRLCLAAAHASQA